LYIWPVGDVLLGLYVSLALLGLAAIDPIGIAAMPVLLLQNDPYRRSFVFLGGSFISLVAMGLLFACGFGTIVLRFETAHTWFVPSIEAAAGAVLLGIAATVFWRLKAGKSSVEPSEAMTKRLRLGSWQLFGLGALLVAVQSVVDVVFVLAMIRIGQLHLRFIALSAAIVTYAMAALVLQFAVIVAYIFTPPRRRAKTLDTVRNLLVRYANQALITVSFLLGCGLLVLAA
jgi:Sap, sulfolipid-1-addressing protein